MALAFRTPDLMRFQRGLRMRMGSATKDRAKFPEVVKSVITTAEVGGTALLFGIAQGKYGGAVLWGVPVDAITGVGLHLLAFANLKFLGGKAVSPHLHAVADGALASFAGALGRQIGRKYQTADDRARIAGLGGGLLASGKSTVGLSGGASLADEELARMVAATR
jgi:hypothetical protein